MLALQARFGFLVGQLTGTPRVARILTFTSSRRRSEMSLHSAGELM